MKLSVIIPVFNEHATLRQIVERVRAAEHVGEIILVDDGSTDGTRQILAELAETPGVCVLYHDRNRGKGAAIRTGVEAATQELVIIQDADLEYDPADYGRLVEPLHAGEADVVFGSRFAERDGAQGRGRWHTLGNRLLTRLSNLVTGLRLTDMETCYKVFRRSVLQRIRIEEDRFGFEPEITAKIARMGCRVREVPITYNSRGYAEGKKIGWRDGVSALRCIVWYSVARDAAPRERSTVSDAPEHGAG